VYVNLYACAKLCLCVCMCKLCTPPHLCQGVVGQEGPPPLFLPMLEGGGGCYRCYVRCCSGGGRWQKRRRDSRRDGGSSGGGLYLAVPQAITVACRSSRTSSRSTSQVAPTPDRAKVNTRQRGHLAFQEGVRGPLVKVLCEHDMNFKKDHLNRSWVQPVACPPSITDIPDSGVDTEFESDKRNARIASCLVILYT
jgi:hypothetical protein